MKNMSFDDLGLLLGVIEIWVVLHILVHGLRFLMLNCDIFMYYLSVLIHSLLRLIIMWNLFLCSLDLVACIIIALSCILLLVWVKFVEIYSMMSSLVILLVFSSMNLIIVHMVLVQKRERGFMSMLWLRPMFPLSWCSFPM
jgi:hypothetical protein